jgi:hypothetical protein
MLRKEGSLDQNGVGVGGVGRVGGVEWSGSLMIVEAFIIHVCACVHAWTECVAGSECVSQCVSQCVSE